MTPGEWLSQFLVGLLTPIIKSVIDKIGLNNTLTAIQDQQTAIIKALGEMNSAKTTDERKQAIRDVAAADNSN